MSTRIKSISYLAVRSTPRKGRSTSSFSQNPFSRARHGTLDTGNMRLRKQPSNPSSPWSVPPGPPPLPSIGRFGQVSVSSTAEEPGLAGVSSSRRCISCTACCRRGDCRGRNAAQLTTWCTLMEYFVARGDHPPLEACLGKVAEADLLVVLVAQRYGWVPPDQAAGQQRSITWLECEQAVSRRQGSAGLPDRRETSLARRGHRGLSSDGGDAKRFGRRSVVPRSESPRGLAEGVQGAGSTAAAFGPRSRLRNTSAAASRKPCTIGGVATRSSHPSTPPALRPPIRALPPRPGRDDRPYRHPGLERGHRPGPSLPHRTAVHLADHHARPVRVGRRRGRTPRERRRSPGRAGTGRRRFDAAPRRRCRTTAWSWSATPARARPRSCAAWPTPWPRPNWARICKPPGSGWESPAGLFPSWSG